MREAIAGEISITLISNGDLFIPSFFEIYQTERQFEMEVDKILDSFFSR